VSDELEPGAYEFRHGELMAVDLRLAPSYAADLWRVLNDFHTASFARLADDPDDAVVHHLYYFDLDELAGIWAADESQAHAIAITIRDLLRLLLQDDELELYLHGETACELVR
jgi:hypothetical protein